MKNKNLQHNKGAAMMMVVLFFVFISLTILLAVVTPVIREYKIVKSSLSSKQAYHLAESGIEDAIYRLKNSMNIDASEIINLNSSSSTTNITDLGGGQKGISSLGDKNSHQRKIDVILSAGEGASFNYGVQIGLGGLEMFNSSQIIGNVYVNGDIIGTSSASITGSAIAANVSAQNLDQENSQGIPSNDILFGKETSSQDFAQSFVSSSTDVISKISIYIKKTGSPSNITVRISPDDNGSPKEETLTSGTLSASQVTSNYGWVNVVLSSSYTLDSGTTYWLVLDGSKSFSNYYYVGGNSAYLNGQAKIGRFSRESWQGTSPSGLDGGFKIYLGGIPSKIEGMTVGDNAMANTINNSVVAGTIYCQTGTGNNKPCDTSQEDPSPLNFPISDGQIADWKDLAVTGGTYSGDINLSSGELSIGPKKIDGNITVSNNAILTLTGNIWVTGSITLSNQGKIKLDPSYGSLSGMIVADGTITTSNGGQFLGAGDPKSYIMVLTTSTLNPAMDISNSAGTVVLVAPYGIVSFSNTAAAKEISANKLIMNNLTTVTYDSGLANINFKTGPSGSWEIESWKESE
ncbi:MAG: polymer-forming cytoskeletal protein [Patescibacteria group bacterium]|nr:polymer-forming cytoskeletal protein [Patescibacteria group bacterium]